MALIQAALDTLNFSDTLRIAKSIIPYVDVIELGTPCIKYSGIGIVTAIVDILSSYENKKVLADLKTMDAGYYEALPFFENGAHITTVMSAADNGTIKGVVEASRKRLHGVSGVDAGQVQVDLLNAYDKVEAAWNASNLGADIVGIHTGLDQQAAGKTPFADLRDVIENGPGDVLVSVAGGINVYTVKRVIESGADIVVVGAAIYGADDPVRAAAEIREEVENGLAS